MSVQLEVPLTAHFILLSSISFFNPVKSSLASIIQKIIIIDLVFSFDSIIAAIGMADNLIVRVVAVVVAGSNS